VARGLRDPAARESQTAEHGAITRRLACTIGDEGQQLRARGEASTQGGADLQRIVVFQQEHGQRLGGRVSNLRKQERPIATASGIPTLRDTGGRCFYMFQEIV
jgi:hypothetical protein